MPEERRTSTPETPLGRAPRVRAFIEAMISEVGEHAEVELRLTGKRDTAYHKAEFIKDIQAIANSALLARGQHYSYSFEESLLEGVL